ncbi:hypothetical protein ASPWEDRAFT_32272 [Aspergillus wentii DTO 134E9]|uniref:Cyanovirin-N domain-containing protein n=1 Tax=Aspergillus wentii DTO 134E9 TaxID=1073089 RepID=A0A1L9R9R4_ASPWE|nr:uncharacterized protein ASPWEDRAFT_32272 [Aspergillus wentii DTO 134E9]KAI9926309.1 hypothetical protein MW887_004073 [Aspergillus wentii]OJJ31660.1 hypothetical protein ASPWEDRAFT_32272 [Aspergillus wentii DTO 134E9]
MSFHKNCQNIRLEVVENQLTRLHCLAETHNGGWLTAWILLDSRIGNDNGVFSTKRGCKDFSKRCIFPQLQTHNGAPWLVAILPRDDNNMLNATGDGPNWQAIDLSRLIKNHNGELEWWDGSRLPL